MDIYLSFCALLPIVGEFSYVRGSKYPHKHHYSYDENRALVNRLSTLKPLGDSM